MSNRVLETVTGYEAAMKKIAFYVKAFNDINGEGRMVASPSGRRADDQEGSGEFFEAVCINADEAENSAAEVYEIQTAW